MTTYPIKARIDRTISPKDAIPAAILEQSPWHWDAQKTDHQDGNSFMFQESTIDWTDLGSWAVEKANADRIPHKYWWWNEDTQEVMHAEDSVNHCPIFETSKQWLVKNDYNEHNTRYFKYANTELATWFEPLKDMFEKTLEDMTMSLFVQPPGQTMPCHVDTYSSYMRKTGEYPDYSRLRRYMTFVSDWDWGHYFHYGNHVMQPWKAGDTWDLTGGIYHGSANCGVTPKITMHWSGKLR